MALEHEAGPVVTVITVVYNAEKSLEATMLSVLSQDWPHIEYLVVDGGSSDGTLDIIRHHASKLSGWISEPDKGIYDAMNKGLRMASGEWVHFLNAGDRFAAGDALSRCMAAALPGDGVVFGDSLIEFDRSIRFQKAGEPKTLPLGLPFSHQSLLVRRESAARIEFDLREGTACDYGMIVRFERAGIAFRYVSHPIAIFQSGGISDTKRVASLRATWAISRQNYGVRWGSTFHFSWSVAWESIKLQIRRMAGRGFMDRLRAWKYRNQRHPDSLP